MSDSKMGDAFTAQAGSRRQLPSDASYAAARRSLQRMEEQFQADADYTLKQTWFYYGWQAAMKSLEAEHE